MSKFITAIPVDVAAVTRLLPKRASVLGVQFVPEAGEVQVLWDDDDFETGYTFATEFSKELLEARKLPHGVKARAVNHRGAEAEKTAPAVPDIVPTPARGKVAGKRVRRAK